VLERSVEDGEARCQQLAADTLSAAGAERAARAALAAAREGAAAAERALQQQTRRLHALEGIRLQDVQVCRRHALVEVHGHLVNGLFVVHGHAFLCM
jgi:hypothetical protein